MIVFVFAESPYVASTQGWNLLYISALVVAPRSSGEPDPISLSGPLVMLLASFFSFLAFAAVAAAAVAAAAVGMFGGFLSPKIPGFCTEPVWAARATGLDTNEAEEETGADPAAVVDEAGVELPVSGAGVELTSWFTWQLIIHSVYKLLDFNGNFLKHFSLKGVLFFWNRSLIRSEINKPLYSYIQVNEQSDGVESKFWFAVSGKSLDKSAATE